MLRRVLPFCLTGLLVACGGSSTSDTAATTATTAPTTVITSPTTPATGGTDPAGSAPASSATPDVAVPAALQLSAPLVGGGEIELDAYAGRPVLLWFWAPW